MRSKQIKKSATFSPAFGKKVSDLTSTSGSKSDHHETNSCLEHNFSNVKIESDQSSQPNGTPSIQTKLKISQPGDKYEQEADRMSAYVMNEATAAPKLSKKVGLNYNLQRQEAKKPPTEGEKYKEAAKKTGEAFLETPLGKRITDKAKEMGEEFLSTLPGKVITGAAAAGAVTAIVAKNAELPIQLPAIPLDRVTPGLSMRITYKGQVRKPSAASITFTYKFWAAKRGGKKQGKTKSEKFRGETARLAREQFEFRESMKSPEQKARDEAFMTRQIVNKTNDPTSPLFIPGLAPKKQAPELEKKKEEENVPLQRKEINSRGGSTGISPLVHDVISSPGQPLDPVTRRTMESRIGHDFSKVRVHRGGKAVQSAKDMKSRAYTVGNNIVIGTGQASSTHEGNRLLAHELSHVVQQTS
ncbi:hypothetical protein SCALIN_C05_0232 [Candidatus Scalindua japonica]|uniref:eCIS core domain-containing protein n=1 Tax=Candidatus Scalindua japonica TaxID=1284222 RepID=A0A286TW76_9BACT|nr:DUF4157 domain-containing protein [Candidatus Scalindua japonica]GAX60147.1 hypothetical protein SCALIN_C05_0232 [Candidatus Scalindua japonica]